MICLSRSENVSGYRRQRHRQRQRRTQTGKLLWRRRRTTTPQQQQQQQVPGPPAGRHCGGRGRRKTKGSWKNGDPVALLYLQAHLAKSAVRPGHLRRAMLTLRAGSSARQRALPQEGSLPGSGCARRGPTGRQQRRAVAMCVACVGSQSKKTMGTVALTETTFVLFGVTKVLRCG